MGIFKSINDTIVSVLSPVQRAAKAADESVEMLAHRIHVNAVASKDSYAIEIMTEHAQRQADLKRQLEEDEDAAAIFKDLMAKL